MTTCRECKRWKDCPTPDLEWFSYGDIKWCKYQVFFLLKYARYLHAGIWPTPESTCETPKRQVSHDAQYVNSAIVIAELDYRLAKTGDKGDILAAECRDPEVEKVDYLSDKAKDALYYVAGWRRKGMSFTNWLKDRKYKRGKILQTG
jgi:hypothetical protein